MNDRAPKLVVFAMFATAVVTLALQVCLSRILSVTLSYHYAFLVVALAMLGMAASSVRVYLERKTGGPRLGSPRAALVAAALVTVGTFGFVFTPSSKAGIALQLVASACVVASAFYYCGYVIAATLADFAKDVTRLYLFDLVGAASGCVLATAALARTSALNAALGCAFVSALAALALAPGRAASRVAAAGLGALVVVAVAFPSITRLRYAKHDQRDVMWEKWTNLARVTVSRRTESSTHEIWEAGWGMSRAFHGEVPETLWLELDSNAGTQIVKNGGLAPRTQNDFLAWDVTAAAYTLPGAHASAFVIGGGGGRDVLTALHFGATHVDVAEINPAVIEAARDVFGAYGGGVYTRPEVHLTIGNARTVLSRSPRKYDVIQMSMIDTWAASMAGQLVLTENTLYTREAFDVFLSHLADDGVLGISRWYDTDEFGQVSRVLALMGDALERAGIPHPEEHVALLYTRGYLGHAVASCLMKRSAFTRADTDALAALVKDKQYTLLWPDVPGVTAHEGLEPGRTIARDPALMRDGPFDLTPPTDERPFFFATRKPIGSFVQALRERRMPRGSSSSIILVSLLVLLLGLGEVFLMRPLRKRAGLSLGALAREHRGPAAYFAGIGAGFMLVELALIQRYIVFLGHPTYGLSVVLFALLLFTGIGSRLSERLTGDLALGVRWPLVFVIAGTLATAFAVPPLLVAVRAWELPARVALAVALIAPLATCMGMIFPTGVRLLTKHEREDAVAWMWGINGFCAVIASVVGMLVATMAGYTAVLVLAMAAYGVTASATRMRW